MGIDTKERQQVTYFFGTEVENTALKGQRTLFVVGIRPVAELVTMLNHEQSMGTTHFYFGTSQSFHPTTEDKWKEWDNMISPLLEKGYWVTVDFGIEYAPGVANMPWNNYHTFIPMISAKLPNIKKFNYNATLKIDDTTWGDTNPGVWCHSLNELMTRDVYTDWKDYVGDTIVNHNE